MNNEPTRYDIVPYPGYTHPQTHPDRLAVIGSLFRLTAAPVTRCRVLELGCGNGSNLIPMAFGLPDSEFTGIDLARLPVGQGQQTIRELGLKNVKLIHGSVTEFDAGHEKFDYIIAHGLFSWVPEEVRSHVLSLCRSCLSPHGIAFISYNARPGSHLRNMLREMMLFHVRGFEAPEERMRQAQALVKFLADAQDTKDEYRLWMKAELDSILGHEPGHLFHDELADISEPFSFSQFNQKAESHGLKYLGEADYFEMFDYGFKDSARAALKQLGKNRILREQYLDFLKCRRFRQTLLCHTEAPAQTEPIAAQVCNFFIGSSAKPANGETDLRPGATVAYKTIKGAQCATDFSLGKAALNLLCAANPMPLAFDELIQKALAMLHGAGIAVEDDCPPTEKLSAFLLDLYSAGVVEFRTMLPRVTQTISEKPLVSALTRSQVQRGTFVTSQFHMAIKIEDEIGRCLLASLDGTLDRNALLDKLWQLLRSKNALDLQGQDEADVRQKIKMQLENNLLKLARMGLLIG
jgi:methyltransferase-like protein/2-polyprenyl-3-methyl-5-hydroxy-6-metoxy-1,4-benzoquinol methylase